jgi:hypothetical protein
LAVYRAIDNQDLINMNTVITTNAIESSETTEGPDNEPDAWQCSTGAPRNRLRDNLPGCHTCHISHVKTAIPISKIEELARKPNKRKRCLNISLRHALRTSHRRAPYGGARAKAFQKRDACSFELRSKYTNLEDFCQNSQMMLLQECKTFGAKSCTFRASGEVANVVVIAVRVIITAQNQPPRSR